MTALPNVSHGASVALGLTAVCYGWGMRLDILCVEDVYRLAMLAVFSYKGEEYWLTLPPMPGQNAEETCKAAFADLHRATLCIMDTFLDLSTEQRRLYLMSNVQKLLGEMA